MPRNGTETRNRILKALAKSGLQTWVSGEKIASDLGISRAALNKHIIELKNQGNIINALPKRGYQLVALTDPWAADLRRGLKTSCIGKQRWIWLKETDSTNQVAMLEAMNKADEGTIVIARRQTEGRGSKGKTWVDMPGSLMFSILVKPEIKPDGISRLIWQTLEACAAAVKDACKLSLDCQLPNDLYLNGKKVGGVLIESLFRNEDLCWVVIGIGLNVNSPADAIPSELSGSATSLYAATGKSFSQKDILKKMLEKLERSILAPKKNARKEQAG